MGDISKGVVFADGQLVSASDLNNLADQAVINPGAVTGPKIAAGAISPGHLAAGFALSPRQVTLAQHLLLAGGSGNAGTAISLGTGLEVSDGALVLEAVPGSALANGSLPPGALAASGTAAGTYGAASRSARLAVNAQGQITGADSAPIAGLARKPAVHPILLPIPAAGAAVSFVISQHEGARAALAPAAVLAPWRDSHA